jgi:flagellin-like protein
MVEPPRWSERGISPAVGVVLMVAIVLLLAVVLAGMVLGVPDRLDENMGLYDEDACPGFQQTEFDATGDDFSALLAELRENNCALWLRAGAVETESGAVTEWTDEGPNDFHATQPDASYRPELVTDSALGRDVVEFDADHSGVNPSDPDPDPGDTDGDYLSINRDVTEMGVDGDSGIVIVATLKVETFSRGGAWTVGEAGSPGQEFSMRTCSSYAVDQCQHPPSDVEGKWRGQHWGSADVDFSSGSESKDEWIVLTHMYNGEEFVIRVNGQEVARSPDELDLSSNRDIQIGRWERVPSEGDPMWYFDGRMAELTIFDRKLTTDEVETVEEYMSNKFDIDLDGPIDS